MNLIDLPNEILLQITQELNDVFEYIRLASVCKKLQTVVRSIVLVVSDSAVKSKLLSTISTDFLQLRVSNNAEFKAHWKRTFEKYQYFIYEYHSVELQAVLAEYVSLIADLKSKPSQKIDVIYMNRNAATVSRAIIFDPRTFIPEKLGQVSRTIYLGDSDQGLNSLQGNGFAPEALLLMGNTHHFNTIDSLPQLYVYANERYPFKIISPSVRRIDGITNVNDKLPRLPTLSNFLQYSFVPNLTTLTGIGIESGMSLELFQTFPNLQQLELDSVFTGITGLLTQLTTKTAHVTLPNLRRLKISGNSISLTNVSFPELYSLDITIRGSTERNFRSTLNLENLVTPALEELYISSSNVPDAPLYILDKLNLKTLKILYLFSSTLSTFPKLEKYQFPSLTEIKLGTFYVSRDDFTPLEPFRLNAPNLKVLNLKNLESFNQALLSSKISYPGLEQLHIQLKVHPEGQNYTLTGEKFPDLKLLNMGFFNKFGKLVSNNINLKIELKTLQKIVTKSELLEAAEGDLDGVEIELLNSTSFSRLSSAGL